MLNNLANALEQHPATDKERPDLHAAIVALIETIRSSKTGDGSEASDTNTEGIGHLARAVAEAARRRPFEPNQGPGKDAATQDDDPPADSSLENTPGETVPKPDDDNPGRGRGNGNGQGNGEGQGQGNGQANGEVEGLSYRDIGGRLGAATGAVRVRCHRARQRLSTAFEAVSALPGNSARDRQ